MSNCGSAGFKQSKLDSKFQSIRCRSCEGRTITPSLLHRQEINLLDTEISANERRDLTNLPAALRCKRLLGEAWPSTCFIITDSP